MNKPWQWQHQWQLELPAVNHDTLIFPPAHKHQSLLTILSQCRQWVTIIADIIRIIFCLHCTDEMIFVLFTTCISLKNKTRLFIHYLWWCACMSNTQVVPRLDDKDRNTVGNKVLFHHFVCRVSQKFQILLFFIGLVAKVIKKKRNHESKSQGVVYFGRSTDSMNNSQI